MNKREWELISEHRDPDMQDLCVRVTRKQKTMSISIGTMRYSRDFRDNSTEEMFTPFIDITRFHRNEWIMRDVSEKIKKLVDSAQKEIQNVFDTEDIFEDGEKNE